MERLLTHPGPWTHCRLDQAQAETTAFLTIIVILPRVGWRACLPAVTISERAFIAAVRRRKRRPAVVQAVVAEEAAREEMIIARLDCDRPFVTATIPALNQANNLNVERSPQQLPIAL